MLVGPLIHLILKEPCLNSSKMNCIRYEICFVLPCSKHPFVIISWQALESIARVGTPLNFHCRIISLISFRTFVVQRISLTASVVTINSASAEDSATVGCFFDAQAIRVYGDNHWKWHDSRGLVSGANKTREFIIRSLGATRRGGVETGMTQEWHLL